MPRDPFENSVAFLIQDVTRLLHREFDERMKPLGLTRAQWWVLSKLHFSNGVTQSELAADLGFSKAALGGLLDRLETNGWIRRRRHPEDRRARLVFLTDKVDPLLDEMRHVANAMNADLQAGLDRAQSRELALLLKRVRANLDPEERLPENLATTDGRRRIKTA